ncbi:MAG: Mur ligase, partial [Gammaproteobacteria bacterium]|nr:Mur ligase [Gammaproteobacteria bacterium]
MNIELLDSRRLTGPNLFWDWPGAVLDISVDGVPAEKVISAWTEEAALLMEAAGWPPQNICYRIYEG